MMINKSKNIQNLDFIFSSIPMPTIIISSDLEIIYINNFAENYLSKNFKNIVGKKLEEVIFFEENIIQLIIKSFNLTFSFTEKYLKVFFPNKGEILINIFFNKISGYDDLAILIFEDFPFAHDRYYDNIKSNLSLSGFSSLISHEIKTPLSSISGAIQLLEENIVKKDKKFINIIKQEINRIIKLVDKMSLFDDINSDFSQNLNIHDILTSVINAAKVGFGKEIKFIELYDPSLPNINGNRDSLVQLFTNLIKNSVEALTNKGEVIICTSFNSDIQFKVLDKKNKKRSFLPIEILIKDKGEGVPKEITEQIFDPFITTKFDGTGLGLPMALKIVTEHNGTINHNFEDGYTIFSVRFPIANKR